MTTFYQFLSDWAQIDVYGVIIHADFENGLVLTEFQIEMVETALFVLKSKCCVECSFVWL